MHKKIPAIEGLRQAGKSHADLLTSEPSSRSPSDLTFKNEIDVISMQRNATFYEIAANLPLRLKDCPHCGSSKVTLHGRYVIRLADIPYVDAAGRSMPVQYAITSQRYRCIGCNHGVVEALPDTLKPVITQARITKRLSEWLFNELLSGQNYETLARMTGYSKIWVRKWFQDVRAQFDLPAKSSKPGPRKKSPPTLL